MSNEWKISGLFIFPERGTLSANLEGPNDSKLEVKPQLPKDWKSKTGAEIETLVFAEAKKLYPQ